MRLSSPVNHSHSCHSALADVFDKFDLSRDGTISIEEYKTLCEEYGVQLTAKDIKAIREIADADGEVTGLAGIKCLMLRLVIKVHKADFILHIKQYNLLKDFQIADPESEFHWKKKADLAFRQTLKHILIFI